MTNKGVKMGVDPQIQVVLENLAKADLTPIELLRPDQARQQMLDMVRARGIVPQEVGPISERIIPGPGGGIPIRLYRPKSATPGNPPVLVYFHGGGHVIGDLESHDSVARALCNGGECAVISVNYRKAPEHKFPAAVEDAFAATRWVHAEGAGLGLDGARMAVGGDSAGANLAAVVALMARDAGGPALRLQLLVYPITDYACVGPDYETYGDGYGILTDSAMRWFRGHYLNDASEATDWRASPLRAASHAGVAPALVITAECDVLHGDGVAYAKALKEAGVEVTHSDYKGMIHAFFSMPTEIDGTAKAQAEASAALRHAFQ